MKYTYNNEIVNTIDVDENEILVRLNNQTFSYTFTKIDLEVFLKPLVHKNFVFFSNYDKGIIKFNTKTKDYELIKVRSIIDWCIVDEEIVSITSSKLVIYDISRNQINIQKNVGDSTDISKTGTHEVLIYRMFRNKSYIYNSLKKEFIELMGFNYSDNYSARFAVYNNDYFILEFVLYRDNEFNSIIRFVKKPSDKNSNKYTVLEDILIKYKKSFNKSPDIGTLISTLPPKIDESLHKRVIKSKGTEITFNNLRGLLGTELTRFIFKE